eukprot:Pgem_evm2s252
MFKLVMICNFVPKISCDKATYRRLRIIPFEATFTDEAPKTFTEQMHKKEFPVDRKFSDKIPELVKYRNLT